MLKGPGPFTVLAPTDNAFQRIPTDRWKALQSKREDLRHRMAYHLVPGNHDRTELVRAGGAKLGTLAGEKISIKRDEENNILIWDGTHTANTVGHEVSATNGVVHLIDAVLGPPSSGM
jgi:uncharacterized surface protein with fasciclin (FAS1) repeats